MTTRGIRAVLLATLGAALLAGGVGAQATDGSAAAEPLADEELPEQTSLCGPPSSLLIDNLEDCDEQTPDGLGGWYYRPGSMEPGSLVVPGGPGHSRCAAHAAGPVDPAQSDWLGVALGCARDVRQLGGYRFAVQGSGDFYAKVVTITTTDVIYGGTCINTSPDPEGSTCGNHYSTREPITLPDDRWYECSIRFRDLRQLDWGTQVPKVRFDLETVTGVEIVPRQGVAYDLTIDNVRFVDHIGRTGCRPLEPLHHPWPPHRH